MGSGSLARSRAAKFGIDPKEFLLTDIHFHIPGGHSKDGPSAVLALLVALISAVTRKPVDSKIAFTGELSLSGKILGVGGFPKKTRAALKGGLTSIFAPGENVDEIRKLIPKKGGGLKIIPVNHIDEALSLLFDKTKRS